MRRRVRLVVMAVAPALDVLIVANRSLEVVEHSLSICASGNDVLGRLAMVGYHGGMRREQLVAFRAEHHLTQVQLAQALGLHEKTIARWEGRNNRASPMLNSRVLALTLEALGRELERRPTPATGEGEG